MFAGIPADWYRKNKIKDYKGYYANVFYAFFSSTGMEAIPEESSNAGRLDMAVKFNGQVYLFEFFKVAEGEAKGKALQQIREKRRTDKYSALNQPIHLILLGAHNAPYKYHAASSLSFRHFAWIEFYRVQSA
ncbi:MAG: PD-(D/E)XK nuclease domain-containing protein [Zoogloeaceae bacterium]|nr:PD-(D/E)XK nuclease domain-containing protein [Zoogloeaceae bacterium]